MKHPFVCPACEEEVWSIGHPGNCNYCGTMTVKREIEGDTVTEIPAMPQEGDEAAIEQAWVSIVTGMELYLKELDEERENEA